MSIPGHVDTEKSEVIVTEFPLHDGLLHIIIIYERQRARWQFVGYGVLNGCIKLMY